MACANRLGVEASAAPREPSEPATVPAEVEDACGACNHSWMSQLEVTAQRILTAFILGEPGKVAATEQEPSLRGFRRRRLGQCWCRPRRSETLATAPSIGAPRLWTLRPRCLAAVKHPRGQPQQHVNGAMVVGGSLQVSLRIAQ